MSNFQKKNSDNIFQTNNSKYHSGNDDRKNLDSLKSLPKLDKLDKLENLINESRIDANENLRLDFN